MGETLVEESENWLSDEALAAMSAPAVPLKTKPVWVCSGSKFKGTDPHEMPMGEPRYWNKCRRCAANEAEGLANAGFHRVPGAYVKALLDQGETERQAWINVADSWANTIGRTRGQILTALNNLKLRTAIDNVMF